MLRGVHLGEQSEGMILTQSLWFTLQLNSNLFCARSNWDVSSWCYVKQTVHIPLTRELCLYPQSVTRKIYRFIQENWNEWCIGERTWVFSRVVGEQTRICQQLPYNWKTMRFIIFFFGEKCYYVGSFANSALLLVPLLRIYKKCLKLINNS